MKLLADLHTHSKYSSLFHGKNTIEEMAIEANELGLVEIAITDHGYNHWCGTNVFKLMKAREEIDEINKWSKTKVLLGVEADIISEDGSLDIDEEALMLIDVLIIGYHRLIKTDFANYFGGQKKDRRAIKKATNAYLNAIERFPVTIVAHLDSILKTDLYEIGKACAQKGVMVEINNRHCNWSEKQVNDLLASGCMFVVSSDAHKREDVGNVSKAFKILKKYDIPRELVANVEFISAEKTEEEQEIDQYYGLYQAKLRAKEEKEKALEEKKKTQFTNSLSEEMEGKLREIAKEKGLHYEEVPDEDDLIDEYNQFRSIYRETEELIKQAKEGVNAGTLQEFDIQNVKVEADKEFIIDEEQNDNENKVSTEEFNSENLSNNEVQAEQNVQDKRFQPSIPQGVLEPMNVIQGLSKESDDVNFNQHQNVVSDSEEQKILSVMQKGNKPVQVEQKVIQSKKKGSVEIEANAIQHKTVKKGVASGASIDSFMKSVKGENIQNDQEKPAPKKPTAQKQKGRGGVFIQINNISDENADNK